MTRAFAAIFLGLGYSLLVCAPAEACPGSPIVAQARPPDRSVVLPQEGWALIEVPGHGRRPEWRAEIFDRAGRRRSTPDVISVGPDHVAVLFARLREGVELDLRLSLSSDQIFQVPIISDGRHDHVGPTTPDLFDLSARPAEPTPCEDSGWWVRARFIGSQDERGVSGYLLLEQNDVGQWVSVGAALQPLTGSEEALELTTFVPRNGRHCYKLAAVDYAVNISRPSDPVCLDFSHRNEDAGAAEDGSVTDAGGSQDAAEPTPDAGLPADPASNTSAPGGSGCQCATPSPEAPVMGLALLWGLLGGRRRRSRIRAKTIAPWGPEEATLGVFAKPGFGADAGPAQPLEIPPARVTLVRSSTDPPLVLTPAARLARWPAVMTRHLPHFGPLAVSVALIACSTDPAPLSDGGAPDSGILVDAGLAADAGSDPDAGQTSDAATDAGPLDSGQAPFQLGVEVEIDSGRVRGVAQDGLRIFKGIPYAEPPTGALRFRPPVPTSPWNGTLQADEFGPSCPQTDFGPELLLGGYGGPQSEDCLSLNVWGHDDENQRPVMVFIYGGGFIAGSSAWPLYDGQHLARNGDVVIVTLNYRVGTLGFLATESLVAEQGAASAGNFGIQDQIEALRWVQRNIRAFGGDPDNVTIFGESAGAISVCALLGAPSADTLFHKAIIQSGMCILGTARAEGLLGAISAIAAGEQTSEDLGCRDAVDPNRCLRNLPVNDLVRATSLFSVLSADINALAGTSPYVDGVLIPEQPLERIARGEADKPLIVGSNAREGVLFAGADTVLTRRGFERAVGEFVGDDALASQIVDLYPLRDFPLVGDAWIAFLGDATFICHGLAAARAAAPGAPAFAYHFTRAPLQLAAVGASHAIELPYLFDTFSQVVIVDGPADRRVSEAMQRAWTSFARTGQPEATPQWAPYTASNPGFLRFDDPLSAADDIRNGRCAALRGLGVTP